MKHYILGLLTAYAVLLTCYAAGMHNGAIASAKQACVASEGIIAAYSGDYLSTMERAAK